MNVRQKQFMQVINSLTEILAFCAAILFNFAFLILEKPEHDVPSVRSRKDVHQGR